MEITTTTVALIGLGMTAVLATVVATVLAWRRRRVTATRLVDWSASSGQPASPSFTDWFAGDPVLFVGADTAQPIAALEAMAEETGASSMIAGEESAPAHTG
jgi:hypothetical protein